LGRALAEAVARRASAAVAAASTPDATAMLARVRRKPGTAKTPGKAAVTPRKAPGALAGITKPHTATPQPLPQALAVAAGPRRSTRTPKIPRAVELQVYWGDPAFGGWQHFEGGTSVRADLGPAAGLTTNYGSGPSRGQCSAVESLNAAVYGGHSWIKGHLLNDNLGGQGVSKNLTPMTHHANMAYKAFEASIKNAIAVCFHQGQFEYVDRWYGVRVAIDVVGQQWPGAPDAAGRAVAQHVVTTADYIEKVGAAAPVVIPQPAWAPALVTGNYACVV
jgi:hypothetical protein